MRLYLDDDSVGHILIQLLRRAGHDVQTPTAVGLAGSADAVHLRHAIQDNRVCLTRNYSDFEDLHLLILEAQGHHPGILVIRRDDDPKRNLSPAGIVRAIRNLEAAGVPIADEYIILNAWR
jgi:predicted nuclease of predicted toxin-antitoxin system